MQDVLIRLQPSGKSSLQAQIREALVSAILGGQMTAEQRVPSSRQLAKSLRVSRNTVMLAYQSLIDRLSALEVGAGAPGVGDELPPFVLPDDDGRLVSLADLLANGPLVVSFNRGNWCPFCWLELSALQDCHHAIVEAGASVVSITPEVATFSRRLKNRLGLGFPVLTDLDNGFALELGLAFALTDDVRAIYDGAGIDLGTFQRSEAWFLPIPATLVIDRRGIVRRSYVNADFRERIEPRNVAGFLSEL